jgi:hypothetical protein
VFRNKINVIKRLSFQIPAIAAITAIPAITRDHGDSQGVTAITAADLSEG